MNIRDQIMNVIENINRTTIDAHYGVLCMQNLFNDKSDTILEYCDDMESFQIYQEENMIKVSDTFDEKLLKKEKTKEILKQFKMYDNLFVYDGKKVSKPIPKKIHDSLFGLAKKMWDVKDYDEYIKLKNLLCDITGIPDDRIIEGSGFARLRQDYLLIRAKHPENKTVSTNKNTKLYHVSNIKGLTQLNPTFLSTYVETVRFVESFYPTQRVYFGIDEPCTRFSSVGKYVHRKDSFVYEYTGPMPSSVKIDTELGGRACFIDTMKPLSVKDVTNEFI